MSASNTHGPAGPSGARMILVMGTVGLVASLALVGTYLATAPRIAANRAAYLQASLAKVLPAATRFQAFSAGASDWLEATDADAGRRVFLALDADSVVGLAVEAAGQGYAGLIRILYGYRPDCECVVGMTVLESKETPGLGDRIEKDPAFLANFEHLAVARDGVPIPVRMVKRGQKTEAWEIDAISGATVSSQAITDILAESTASLVADLQRLGPPPVSPPPATAGGGGLP